MMQLVPNPQARYRNLFEAFKTIFHKENPRVLFKGIGVVAVGAGPAHAMYFSSYEFSKRWLSQYHSNIISQGGCGCQRVWFSLFLQVQLLP